MVDIWYFAWDAPPSADLVEALRPSLSIGEREQYHRFYFDRDRHAYLFAHVLLRRVLSQCHSIPEGLWEFLTGSHGKPFVASPPVDLHFSITHTAGMVACATSTDPEIGVDAERIDRKCKYLELARSIFAPAEVRALENGPEAQLPDRFFTTWTLKEAYIKARGLGLSLPLQDFEVRPFPDGTAGIAFFRGIDADPSQWKLRVFRPNMAHILSAAARRSSPVEFLLHDAAGLLGAT